MENNITLIDNIDQYTDGTYAQFAAVTNDNRMVESDIYEFAITQYGNRVYLPLIEEVQRSAAYMWRQIQSKLALATGAVVLKYALVSDGVKVAYRETAPCGRYDLLFECLGDEFMETTLRHLIIKHLVEIT